MSTLIQGFKNVEMNKLTDFFTTPQIVSRNLFICFGLVSSEYIDKYTLTVPKCKCRNHKSFYNMYTYVPYLFTLVRNKIRIIVTNTIHLSWLIFQMLSLHFLSFQQLTHYHSWVDKSTTYPPLRKNVLKNKECFQCLHLNSIFSENATPFHW